MRRDLDRPPGQPRPDGRDPTRAQPDPWFGLGRRGVIGVAAAVGLFLLKVHVISFWIAHEAWTWWQHPATITFSTGPVLPADHRMDPSPPRVMIPPLDPARAMQPVRGEPARYYSMDDYPADALCRGEQGRTVATLTVDASGTPTQCAIDQSSGSRSLDAATCSIAIGRVRLEPARDERGRAIAGHYPLHIRWVLPQD